MNAQPQNPRKIIHVDMDAFFASVEQRDNPNYRGHPVAVGGSPEGRGVVAAASYEARKFGIFSAMPARTAIQKCPHLIFVRPRFDVYRQISEQIRAIFHEYTDLVEPLSLDEAYLDVTENKPGIPSATLIARDIKKRILEETSLTASAGISINKFLAKTASGIRKPNGMYLIPPDKAEAFMETLPIEDFYGVGDVTAKKMHQLGIRNGADLKSWSERDLLDKFGKAGAWYYLIARAQDDRVVCPNRVRKSVGAEESFAEDLKDRGEMMMQLGEIAKTLVRRIGDNGGGRTLTLKVKYANYQQVTRSRTVLDTINQFDNIMKIANDLLDTTEAEERNVRLLGLTLSNLDSEREHDEWVQLTLQFT
ncbi:MAG: DNA polymerase IV [Candidatus Melainabacteria bacterium]|nr:DNA polymerase IV [Candidatus Melainabacteria bacterium]